MSWILCGLDKAHGAPSTPHSLTLYCKVYHLSSKSIKNVLDVCKIWDSKYVGDLSADWKVIFPALMLSYHDLSANLKRLFAYCSLFPKDFLFNKEELVLLWMAEGLLNQSNATKSQEDFGQDDFEALLSRSFFQHAPNDETLYVMHDLMNDLATFVAKDFFLRFENHTESRKEALTKYRHMSVISEKYGVYKKFEPFKRARSLRTLLVLYVGQNHIRFYISSKFFIDLLPQLPLLRVLSLSGFDIREVPDFICSLKHLRYLNLSETFIKKLPDNIGNLFNLQILIVCGCYKLTKLPKSFLKLKNLRHFDFRGTSSLKKLPLGIGKLKNLQTLPKIVIEEEDGGFAITELKGLNNLRGKLSIEGLCKVQSEMQAHEAQLTLKRLTKLKLNWGEGSQHGTPQKEVLEELKPDSEWLKELAVKSYGGIEFPKWVGHPSFHRLVDVSISDCKNCTSLPPLGQLPSLKELNISSMPNVKFIGLEFTGTNQLSFAAFPSLEILRFRNMSSWKVWLTSNEVFDAVFPCLRELEILHCPKLIEFSPETLPSLEIIRLYTCGWKGWSINGEVSALSRLRELHIGNCSKLIELSPETLPSLEILRFQNMLGWKIWSTSNAVFHCLRELCIENCPKLVDVSAEALPLLKVLKITRCGVGVLRSLVRAASSIAIMHMESISGLTYEVWRGVIEHLGAVEKVRIDGCDEIRFLWESEEEASKVLVNIKELTVLRCFNLVSLGEKEEEDNMGGSNLSSLRMLMVRSCGNMEQCCCPHSIERLDIGYCRSLTHVSFPTSATGGGQKLKSLHIRDCGNLKSIMQLGNFIYLTELYLNDCPSLESFPDIQLPVLTRLTVEKCKSMESFSALQMASLTLLQELTIRDCPSIDASCHGGFWPPNLCFLELGRLKKPMSEWGPQNCPTSLVKLQLFDEPCVSNFRQLSNLFPSSLTELEIYDFDNLESLSTGLQHLTSLQHLSIVRCPKMKYLPKHLLPSLFNLKIISCPKLRKRCKGRGSHYYPLISHIRFVNIKY